jgi:hypothetical protein
MPKGNQFAYLLLCTDALVSPAGLLWLPHRRKLQTRPVSLEEVQMDMKDVRSAPADPKGKQRHVVDLFNMVDASTFKSVQKSFTFRLRHFQRLPVARSAYTRSPECDYGHGVFHREF